MEKLEFLIKNLDCAIWELSEAFRDFPEEDLWKRPSPELLSVGELAVHIAYGELNTFFPDMSTELNIRTSSYYPYNLPNQVVLNLTSQQLFEEVKRVHEACKAKMLEMNPNLSERNTNRPDWTWEYSFIYQGFHIAYHTGQIYSVRHLLGHVTPDN